jgi:hypothetical protein
MLGRGFLASLVLATPLSPLSIHVFLPAVQLHGPIVGHLLSRSVEMLQDGSAFPMVALCAIGAVCASLCFALLRDPAGGLPGASSLR